MSASSSAPAAKKAPTWGGPPIIEVHEIKIISQIGSGCFGKVFRGVCRSVDVAVKVPNKQSFDPKQLQAFHHEVQIMSKIFAPNVCLFMGACLVPGNIRIVTELMEGDLERLLLDHSIELSLSVRMKMAKDAAQGMAWLHGNDPPVLHRDLKAANLLYDSTRRIKVCDFGLAETRPVGRELYDRQPKGTPLYMAPEVMEQKVITEKVDVYSFGIILWEIYTRKEAYTQFEDYDSFFQGVVKRQERPPIPADMPGPLVELTSRCWAHDPAVRPPFSEIVVELEKIRLAAEHRELEQVIESKLTDPRVCTMWKTQFLGQPVVRWPHFAAAFYTLIGLPPPTADEPVLTEDASLDQIQQASMEQLEAFGKISPECQSLVEDEKSRRRAAASEKDVVVPAGYENSSGPAPAAAAEPSDYVFYQHSEESINAHAACLKSLVCLEKDVVDLSALERTLQCFGPASPEMLDRIYNLMKQPYFHGLLPTADADHMLCVESRGTFLVRFSNNRPRSICISKVSMPGMVRHMITTRIDDSWTFDDQRYPSVEALIEGIRATQNLETPYRTAPFAWIFKSK